MTHILLVDDHPLFVEGLKDLLNRRGFHVIGVARDGLEALQQARAQHPDLILMDIHMPTCNGLTATRLIKAEMPTIKIVMLTMAEDEASLFEAIRSGASGYLLKTLDLGEFIHLLEGVVQGEMPFAPGLAAKILQEFRHPPTSPTQTSDRLRELSPRQQQILHLAAQSLTYKEIGAMLGLAERTVKYHMGEIIERLHMQNRAEVLAFARQMGGMPHA
jgi:two-component system NarL family response regulator